MDKSQLMNLIEAGYSLDDINKISSAMELMNKTPEAPAPEAPAPEAKEPEAPAPIIEDDFKAFVTEELKKLNTRITLNNIRNDSIDSPSEKDIYTQMAEMLEGNGGK